MSHLHHPVLLLAAPAALVLLPLGAVVIFALRRRGWIICRTAARAWFAWAVGILVPMSGLLLVVTWTVLPALLVLGYTCGKTCGDLLRIHGCHYVDCVFGPRTPPVGSKVRLFAWRKVSIRPGFAAT